MNVNVKLHETKNNGDNMNSSFQRVLSAIALLVVSACSEQKVETSQDSEASTGTLAALVERAGAPLFDGMSDYEMPITAQNADAQRYFNQGMVLAFAFNHAESIRSFRAAQTLDPSCAMCFKGEALATGPNINVTSKGKVIMSAAEREAAFAVLQQALALKANATPREQAYIEALQPAIMASRRLIVSPLIKLGRNQCARLRSSTRKT